MWGTNWIPPQHYRMFHYMMPTHVFCQRPAPCLTWCPTSSECDVVFVSSLWLIREPLEEGWRLGSLSASQQLWRLRFGLFAAFQFGGWSSADQVDNMCHLNLMVENWTWDFWPMGILLGLKPTGWSKSRIWFNQQKKNKWNQQPPLKSIKYWLQFDAMPRKYKVLAQNIWHMTKSLWCNNKSKPASVSLIPVALFWCILTFLMIYL